MMMMMTMQTFPRPLPLPVVACRCCCKLEIALPSPDYQNQGRRTSQVDFCDAQREGQNFSCRMRRQARKGTSSRVFSGRTDQMTLTRGDTMATTAVRNSAMDCHGHQEERATTSSLFRSSILDCNSSSGAVDELCNDLNGRRRGNDVNTETKTVLARSQGCNISSSSVTPPQIECFNEADISAACLLLEMSSTTTSHSADDVLAEDETSQTQPCPIIRVSDDHERAATAPSLPPVSPISEQQMGLKGSAGFSRATDDEVGGTVQERKAPWEGEATYTSSSTPRSLRVELRTLGKKRIKPRKDERELLFGINQEALTSENKFDILDRPTRKRHFKSLRELLGVK